MVVQGKQDNMYYLKLVGVYTGDLHHPHARPSERQHLPYGWYVCVYASVCMPVPLDVSVSVFPPVCPRVCVCLCPCLCLCPCPCLCLCLSAPVPMYLPSPCLCVDMPRCPCPCRLCLCMRGTRTDKMASMKHNLRKSFNSSLRH